MAVWTRKPRGAKHLLTVGRAYDLGTDPTDGEWSVICEAHSTVVNTDTRAEALTVRGVDFCDDCRDDVPACACSVGADHSVVTSRCPQHADRDPCYSLALVTGKRRQGTIRNGVCTHCGWRDR